MMRFENKGDPGLTLRLLSCYEQLSSREFWTSFNFISPEHIKQNWIILKEGLAASVDTSFRQGSGLIRPSERIWGTVTNPMPRETCILVLDCFLFSLLTLLSHLKPLFHDLLIQRKALVKCKWKQELANYGPWAKSGPHPPFVNKVLLEQSHAYANDCFCTTTASWIIAAESLWPAKPYVIVLSSFISVKVFWFLMCVNTTFFLIWKIEMEIPDSSSDWVPLGALAV